MANSNHLELVLKDIDLWNKWREKNPAIKPNLSGANLSGNDLYRANFNNTNLFKANLSNAELQNANFSNANIEAVDFGSSNLRDSDFSDASSVCCDYSATDLNNAKFIKANLSGSDFSSTYLIDADFSFSSLTKCDFRNANLIGAILSNADLTDASLIGSQVLNTTFTRANLTGACIADWQIGSTTNLGGIICDYIFRHVDKGRFSGRLPVDSDSTFALGEFELWAEVRASALETIDLTFLNGIDWQVFFSSLQDVRLQNPDTGIFLQGVEEREGRYVVRLRIETEKTGQEREMLEARIETTTKELFETRRQLDEARGEIKGLKWALEPTLKRATYDLRGSQFGGGFAETVEGDQIGGNQTQ